MTKPLAKTMPASASTDPLLGAINHFLAGGDQHEELPEDLPEDEQDAAFERLCGAPEEVLLNWRDPAMTRESAIAALRLALTGLEEDDAEPIHCNLIRVALSFLDGWRPS